VDGIAPLTRRKHLRRSATTDHLPKDRLQRGLQRLAARAASDDLLGI
jgi:hypothetical protein